MKPGIHRAVRRADTRCSRGPNFRLSEKVNVAYLISKAKDPQRTPKEHPKRHQLMVQRTPNTRRGRGPDRPLIADELERLRKKPPRASKTEPLSQLDRLAILNGIRDGNALARKATQWNLSVRTVERVRGSLYDEPLSIFD